MRLAPNLVHMIGPHTALSIGGPDDADAQRSVQASAGRVHPPRVPAWSRRCVEDDWRACCELAFDGRLRPWDPLTERHRPHPTALQQAWKPKPRRPADRGRWCLRARQG